MLNLMMYEIATKNPQQVKPKTRIWMALGVLVCFVVGFIIGAKVVPMLW